MRDRKKKTNQVASLSLGNNLQGFVQDILLSADVEVDSSLLSRFRPETRKLLYSQSDNKLRPARKTLTLDGDVAISSGSSIHSSDAQIATLSTKTMSLQAPIFVPAEPVQYVRDLPEDFIPLQGYVQTSQSAPELCKNTLGHYASVYSSPGSAKTSKKKAPQAQHRYFTGNFAWQLDPNPGAYIIEAAGKNVLFPQYWQDKGFKDKLFAEKSRHLYQDDAKLLSAPELAQVAARPIHVFVDLSNIIIGWVQLLKLNRSISERTRCKMPAFYFEAFDRLLVRDRPVDKKILAGSVSHSQNSRWPDHMYKAEELGYDMNIMQRVLKSVDSPVKISANAKSDGEATSGADVSSEEVFTRFPGKYSEQGVDEILHLKMMQSGMDFGSVPGTIVLATGDAAAAQFSDGFKANVERLLAAGWNVEVYAWGHNLSTAWKDKTFRDYWKGQFRLVRLDPFAEELYACYFDD